MFKKGDKVRCIENDDVETCLTIDKIYDVLEVKEVKNEGTTREILKICDDNDNLW
jgi:hypothetical protein